MQLSKMHGRSVPRMNTTCSVGIYLQHEKTLHSAGSVCFTAEVCKKVSSQTEVERNCFDTKAMV